MRTHGLVTGVPETNAGDHLCCVYDDDATFDATVRQFLAGGLARGERLLCVGERVIDSLLAGASPISGVADLVADGRLEMLTVAEAYPATGPFRPEQQLAFYDEATRRAVDEGYRGLRVIADVTPLAADPDSRPELVRWEHMADEYVAHGPGMSAMCVYRGDLPQDAITAAATAHPLVHTSAGVPPFRIFFEDDRLAVAGEVDTFDAARLAGVLAGLPVEGPVVTLDLAFLAFIDAAGCRVLARWALDLQARSIALELRDASPLVQRMWQILGLAELAPVTFTGAGA
jgi:anti-anti-sigma regulatory factor